MQYIDNPFPLFVASSRSKIPLSFNLSIAYLMPFWDIPIFALFLSV